MIDPYHQTPCSVLYLCLVSAMVLLLIQDIYLSKKTIIEGYKDVVLNTVFEEIG